MAEADRLRWDARYLTLAEQQTDWLDVPGPDEWLTRQAIKLPPGRTVDLACGLGGNARWLAQQGWDVLGIDVSPVALSVAQRWCAPANRPVSWQVADLETCELPEQSFDLVCVFRYLDRQRFPNWLPRLLRPGGWLIYQTFVSPPPSAAPGTKSPKNPAHVLGPGELKQLFALTTIDYQETQQLEGWMASLAAQRT
ncbi:MAG: class I SAM-dependent methyltransferase [Planctomycetaceae bacterium]|jgi:SAM-dependent methyltransferase